MISEQTFKEFQAVVKKKYGTALSMEDTRDILQGMVNYFDLLAKIDARKDPAEAEKEKDLSSVDAPKPSEHLEDVL